MSLFNVYQGYRQYNETVQLTDYSRHTITNTHFFLFRMSNYYVLILDSMLRNVFYNNIIMPINNPLFDK